MVRVAAEPRRGRLRHSANPGHFRQGRCRADGPLVDLAAHGRRLLAKRAQPFANFFFGGFGNNYVDHADEKRYRQSYALPGFDLNEIGGRNFLKSTVEWNLPPWRFSRVGTPGFYATWLRPGLFVGGLTTNIDARSARRTTTDTGAQIDLKLTMLSELELTLSVGGAVAFEKGQPVRREAMISLKILK